MKTLNNYNEEELIDIVKNLGLERYRADQIFRAIHQRYIFDIDDLSQLSKAQRQILKDNYYIKKIDILKIFHSKLDDTIKMLYKLEDDTLIEGVLMKYKHGYTLCVSTQVGCLMGCDFCASTKNGLIRDLEVSEIISQIYVVEKEFDIEISNIVLMGSGEPFDNYDNTIKALRILNSEKGKHMSFRNMTISTCGLVDKILKFSEEDIPVNLAVSLHSLDNIKRSEIMPINRKYNTSLLISSIREYIKKTNNRISFEYTVIDGFNNTDEDIRLMKDNFKGLNYIVNLIALNPIKDYNENTDTLYSAREFKSRLDKAGINNTLRRELGSDISASCGQLKASYLKEGELR